MQTQNHVEGDFLKKNGLQRDLHCIQRDTSPQNMSGPFQKRETVVSKDLGEFDAPGHSVQSWGDNSCFPTVGQAAKTNICNHQNKSLWKQDLKLYLSELNKNVCIKHFMEKKNPTNTTFQSRLLTSDIILSPADDKWLAAHSHAGCSYISPVVFFFWLLWSLAIKMWARGTVT